MDSSCHLPNPDVHTPVARLEGQGDGWWKDGRQREAVIAVCGQSQESIQGWGWLDQAGRKREHAWQAASEPLTHRSVLALTEVDTTGCITARILNIATQAGPFEWHDYVFSDVSWIDSKGKYIWKYLFIKPTNQVRMRKKKLWLQVMHCFFHLFFC